VLRILVNLGWSLVEGELEDLLVILALLPSLVFVIWMVVLAVRYSVHLSNAYYAALGRARRDAAANQSPDESYGPRATMGDLLRSAAIVCTLLAVCGGVTFLWSHKQISQLNKELQDEDPLVRASAVGKFYRYGRAAVPPLIDALEDEDKRVRESAQHVGSIGKPAVPALVELLNDEGARLRRWGATPPIRGADGQTPALFRALRQSLHNTRSTLRGNRELTTALNAAAEDEDEVIRYYAASVLTPHGLERERDELEKGSGGKPLDFWIGHLKHDNPNVRSWAAYYVDSKDKAVVPMLIESLKHQDLFVREWAAHRLREIGSDATVAVPALVKTLADKEQRVRSAAARALSQIGRNGNIWEDPELVEVAVPRLVNVLKEEKYHSFAAGALGQIGPAAKEAVPPLVEASKKDSIRFAATEALKKIDPGTAAKVLGIIGPDAGEAVPALIAVLGGEDASVRKRAAQFLGFIGPDAGEAAPTLVKLLKDEEVGATAAEALGKIGVIAVPPLISEAGKEDSHVRVQAIQALGKMGPAAEQAVPILIAAYESEDVSVRLATGVSLGRLGPSAKEAAPALVQGLEDENGHVRVHAADALRSLGWQDREKLLTVLIEGLQYESARACAVTALGKFGPEAVPMLIETAKDNSEWYGVSQAAVKALNKIDPKAAAEIGLNELEGAGKGASRQGQATTQKRQGPGADGHINVLIDASRDGGVWWSGKPSNTDHENSKTHQGYPLAAYLRERGYRVKELKQNVEITYGLLHRCDLVIRASAYPNVLVPPRTFVAYREEELDAYCAYVRNGGKLLLIPGTLKPKRSDRHYTYELHYDHLADAFGIRMEGMGRGTKDIAKSHPLTEGVDYISSGARVIKHPPSATILAPVSEEYGGGGTFGFMPYGEGMIVFGSNTNAMQRLPQPLTDNIFDWLLGESAEK
jgi:HEAT repeat protein